MTNLLIRVAAVVALTATATATAIATAPMAQAAVYNPQQQLPASVIDAFKANPAQLLQQFPVGGAQLISRIRDLAASDPSTLPLIIGLLKSADPKTQVPAIAAGLAQVARLASRTDQAYANEIQAAIAGSGVPEAVAAYQASTGDVAIAATGGGGAGGGGTGAGGPTGSSGFVFGGNNGGANTFGGLHYSTLTTQQGTGSVGGSSSSVSSR